MHKLATLYVLQMKWMALDGQLDLGLPWLHGGQRDENLGPLADDDQRQDKIKLPLLVFYRERKKMREKSS
jgi:hypothetical protein